MTTARKYGFGLGSVLVLSLGLAGAWAQPQPAAPPTSRPAPPEVPQPQPQPTTAPASTSAPATTSAPALAVVLEITHAGEDWGRIVVELERAKAPITVNNFLQYVDDGYYDGTIFHRVVPDYLIQGGGYVSLDTMKRTGLRRPIRDEAKNALKNTRGTIGMARVRTPHSATSQFYINLVDNPKLDYPADDGWGYCAFGRVIEGLEIVDKIRSVRTQRDPNGSDSTPSQPIDPPKIKHAYRLGGAPSSQPADLYKLDEEAIEREEQREAAPPGIPPPPPPPAPEETPPPNPNPQP
jgi:peptidyl-prolyl cis-trans isomerase A (cyclophilin A)